MSFTCMWVLVCIQFRGVPLRAHVLLLNGHAGHLAQSDAHLDVSELQTKVLPQDGHPGSPLARPRLREQLDQQEVEDRGQNGWRRRGDRKTAKEGTEKRQKNMKVEGKLDKKKTIFNIL